MANYAYCAWDSGLGRGFTEYRDYNFPRLTAFKTAILVDYSVEGLRTVKSFLEDWFDLNLLRSADSLLWWLIKGDLKRADVVNREFLDWLSQRSRPERPFFAFLNFFDAHHPYRLPLATFHRFGDASDEDHGIDPVEEEILRTHRPPSEPKVALVRDAYDDCIANLDEQLGILIDELQSRGVLERTWVIIVADHGESFGEHPMVFRHGMSLYQTEVRVPLVIVPPAGKPAQQVVTETASIRDLPATVVDILGFKAGSPFPGDSLARFWNGSSPVESAAAGLATANHALAELVPIDPFRTDPWRPDSRRVPVAALVEGDWSYIRRDTDGREMLFNLCRHQAVTRPCRSSIFATRARAFVRRDESTYGRSVDFKTV